LTDAGLLAEDFASSLFADAAPANPLTLRPPHYPAKAKRVIFLFMSGGPSHVDTFDPKPRLAQDNGQPYLQFRPDRIGSLKPDSINLPTLLLPGAMTSFLEFNKGPSWRRYDEG